MDEAMTLKLLAVVFCPLHHGIVGAFVQFVCELAFAVVCLFCLALPDLRLFS